jgi:hypothetical protein
MITATAESAAMPEAEAPLSALRRWSITVTVMTVTVMQVLDVTVINVALPHMQGSLLCQGNLRGPCLRTGFMSATLVRSSCARQLMIGWVR